MMTRRIVLAALLCAAPAAGQTPAGRIAPLIDGDTFFVAHVDLGKANPEPVAAFVGHFTDENPAAILLALQGTLQIARDCGVKEVYVVYATADVPREPCVLTPDTDGLKLEQIRERIPTGLTIDTVGGFRVLGRSEGIARLKAVKPVARPEVAAAFEAAGDATMRAAVLPTESFRKAFEQISPTFPAELGGGSIRLLTRKWQWLAIGVTTDKGLPVRAEIKTDDAESAEGIRALINRGFEWVGGQEASPAGRTVKQLYGDLFDHAVTVLTPERDGDRLRLSLKANELAAEFAKELREHPLAALTMSQNNLKQIGLAMHNHESATRRFPSDIRDKDGKPLLSWRVVILPYIEQDNLYRRFKLDEPWDSEHNIKLLKEIPETLRSPAQRKALEGATSYLGIAGKSGLFSAGGVRILDAKDGLSNTIAVVETGDDRAVPWTKPADLLPDAETSPADLTGHFDGGFNALFGDGSVRFLKQALGPRTFRAMLTRDGGEPIDW